MKAAVAMPPAAPESLDERIARLKAELADAELDKAGDALASITGEFLELVPDYRVADGPLPTVEELEAATAFVTSAWDAFTLWRKELAARRAEEQERRPYLALPSVPRALLPSGRSPAGAGSVYAAGKGFRWRLSRDGKLIGSRTWPTRAEAEAELALAVADPAFVPAPKDRKRLGDTGTGRKHHCSNCGGEDHRAPACPDASRAPSTAEEGTAAAAIPAGADLVATMAAASAAEPEVTDARAATVKRLVAARVAPGLAERMANAERPPPSVPFDLGAIPRFSIAEEIEDEGYRRAAQTRRDRLLREHLTQSADIPVADDEPDDDDTPGWSPPDASGRQTCLPCDGEGIDNRPGPGAGNCCLHCDGEGYRWVEAASGADERRSA